MHSLHITSAVVSLLAGQAWAATGLDCRKILTGDQHFDLSALKGPHSVVTSRYESIPQTHLNTTYTLDICEPLKKSGKAKKTEECPNGTRVCAIQRLLSGDTDNITEVVAIAGSLEDNGGTKFEYKADRLRTSDSNGDSQKEGLRLILEGGRHPLDGPLKERRKQTAIIEFLCDKEKEGTEGEWDSEDKYEKSEKKRRDEDKKEEEGDKDEDEGESAVEHQLKKDDAALIWESYGQEKDGDVLRLTWYTKHACESSSGGSGPPESSSSHWGFFTWFIIILFLGIAAYLIFGSWLNYNRYGARGWDLLPHGDTIRDIPYLLKDWTRRVLNTVQGAGSRGGYSAV